jgi:hypothetical protein
MSLGPGMPKSKAGLPVFRQAHRHQLPSGWRVVNWARLFELGEELAATDTPERDTLTAAVLAMRR